MNKQREIDVKESPAAASKVVVMGRVTEETKNSNQPQINDNWPLTGFSG